jgi:hypothetical protein
MSFTRNVLVAAAFLAAAPAPALLAQQGGGYPQGGYPQGRGDGQREGRDYERGPRGDRFGSPVQRLIQAQQQLGLSADQVNRLQRIDQALQQRTEPLRRQLEQYGPPRGQFGGRDGQDQQGQRQEPSEQDRQAMRQRMEQARPVFEQLRKANDEAVEQAMKVLSSSQRQQARQLLPRRGERRGGRGEGRGQGRGWNRGQDRQGGQGWNRGGGSR